MVGRRVRAGDTARQSLLAGADWLASAVLPTLGPRARMVAAEQTLRHETPAILDNGAAISRRMLRHPDPWADMGAMVLRQLACTVADRLGDGAATSVALAQAFLHTGVRRLAAGHNAMDIRRELGTVLELATDALAAMAWPIETRAELAAVTAAAVRDPALTRMIAEIMESVEADGAILIEEAEGADTGYEYLDGISWDEGYASYHLLRDGESRATVMNPRVLVTTHDLTHAAQLLPTIEACLQTGTRDLAVIAPAVRDDALALLLINRERGVLNNVLAVRAPGHGERQIGILEDLAIASGARCVRAALHERLATVSPQDLGTARQIWATARAFGVIGAAGTRAAVRERVRTLRVQLRDTTDDARRQELRERIGKLSGVGAVIRVGAPTVSTKADQRARVEAGFRTARAALEGGLLPGGGAALVHVARACEQSSRTDLNAGERAFLAALSQPMRLLIANAGGDPHPVLEQARQRAIGETYDVIGGRWVDARISGIVDAFGVVRYALAASVSAATTILTTETLVRRRNPPLSIEP